jgi:uncharacterized membrane protein YbhN (UPF0104 family)
VRKQTLINLGKYLLAIGLLAWVIYDNWAPAHGKGLSYVVRTHFIEGKPIHGGYLLAGVLIYLAAVVLTFFRWYLLVRAVELPFRPADALRLGLIGLFFNAFLPGSVGGDIIKAAVLAREQSRRTVAVATVIMDRAIALWALIWFVAISGGVFWAAGLLDEQLARRSKGLIVGAAVVAVVSLTGWLLLGLLPAWRAERFAGRLQRLPRVGTSAAEFWRAIWMYRCRQATVALVMGLSWIGHVGFVFGFWCCANVLWSEELGPIPPLAEHFLLVPIGLVVQAIVPTPGGAGGGEWGFGKLYQLFGGSQVNGTLGSLVQRVITWMLGLLGGVVYLRLRATLRAAAERDAAPEPAVMVNGQAGIHVRSNAILSEPEA